MKEEITQQNLILIFNYSDGNLIYKDKITTSNRKIGSVAGTIAKDGRKYIKFNKKQYLSHRLIFLFHHGYLPKYIDHIDRNPSNNKIENLRACTQSQNMGNKISNVKKIGYKGVFFLKNNKSNPWWVKIGTKHIGNFKTQEEAALAYNKEAIKLFGEFAKLNILIK